MMQLSLFPDLVPSKRVRERPSLESVGSPQTHEQLNYERAYWFERSTFAWYGALLAGMFDTKLNLEGGYLRGITFSFNLLRPVASVKKRREGEPMIAFVVGSSRRAMLQALRTALREGGLVWRPDKYAK